MGNMNWEIEFISQEPEYCVERFSEMNSEVVGNTGVSSYKY